jgi:hypothetical protein
MTIEKGHHSYAYDSGMEAMYVESIPLTFPLAVGNISTNGKWFNQISF